MEYMDGLCRWMNMDVYTPQGLLMKNFLMTLPHMVWSSSPVTKGSMLMLPWSRGHSLTRLSPPPYQ